jgi:coenzyme F420-reducing hydrogenase delta subunit
MANQNEVDAIYKAIDELNKRVDKLAANGTIEQRVKAMEVYINDVDKAFKSINEFIKQIIDNLSFLK